MVLIANTQKRFDRFPRGRCPCGPAPAETALAELGKRDRRGQLNQMKPKLEMFRSVGQQARQQTVFAHYSCCRTINVNSGSSALEWHTTLKQPRFLQYVAAFTQGVGHACS